MVYWIRHRTGICNEIEKMKLLIIGSGGHGKDEFAQTLGVDHKSSSEAALDLFMWDLLKEEYHNKEECYSDRRNRRELWYNHIVKYNTPDKSRLAREISLRWGSYIGMRDLEEFENSKTLFDLVIYVDASERVKPIDPTMKIPKSMADIVIENNGTIKEFHEKIDRIKEVLSV